jgi:hypothetical protein
LGRFKSQIRIRPSGPDPVTLPPGITTAFSLLVSINREEGNVLFASGYKMNKLLVSDLLMIRSYYCLSV